MKKLLLALAVAVFPIAVGAVEPDEMLEDAALEARAREISKELRCVVCQNQDIDSSNAGVARDLRLLVRERLLAGDSDAEVIEYIRARYGDYVLLKPPLEPSTYALWFAPVGFILIGLLTGFVVLSRNRKPEVVSALNEDDEKTVSEFLRNSDAGDAP
ncbi:MULTISPECIES: cytochrome c-type biogenesis protein [Mameliella]|uniref:cytochrome c-type biogenesis protein n=1 Tax=Mameliella TaxID=1434019 RepID=UPI000B537FAB|nr:MULTISPECIES: cytochrome c-type biogenesis protein [Mameliella]OWV40299.1 cytochrome C biogenesis protein CcmH [Mameliella alba]OWV58851.1 cytochrome C biogenesis protein CcmH [Mameliella alba]